MGIEIKLFGMPHIRRGGEEILFPYSKINAMIYYLAVNGSITRTEIAGLLWPEEDDIIAKKNLRNAIYQAKRCVGEEFILSPKKSLLELNPALEISIDANEFAADPEANLSLYDGEFLQGFFVKDSEQYDYWVMKMRSFYEEKYIAHAYHRLEEAIEEGHYENVEKSIHTLIGMDEYDERNVRLLMRFYAKTGRTGKVIETYFNLKQLLQDELGVSPDVETQAIYEEAINQIELSGHRRKKKTQFFYGRFKEQALIEKSLQHIGEETNVSFLIQGEAGIGKSALLRNVLEEKTEDTIVLQAYCYQAEQMYTLRPFSILIERLGAMLKEKNIALPTFWAGTMHKLFPSPDGARKEMLFPEANESLNFDQLAKIVVDAIKKLSEQSKVLIVFEDVQWMDDVSIQLLTTVMLRLEHRAMFLMTAQPIGNQALSDAVATLGHYDLLDRIDLERFDREETEAMIREATKEELDAKMLDRIYRETEGNPFFITEVMQILNTSDADWLMTEKMKDAMKARFAYLSKPERDLVDQISLFYDEAPLSVLVDLTGRSESDIIGLLEHLERSNILLERTHDSDIGIRFTHVKLREYIYLNQPQSKRRVLHKRIAQILEDRLSRKKSLYTFSKLVYHYTKAEEPLKSIEFELATLNYYLNFSHELFPILTIRDPEEQDQVYISRDRMQQMLGELEQKFEALRRSALSDDLTRLEMQFYYMKGRYLIREGVYAEGLSDMRLAVEKAKAVDDKDYVLEGYKQFIFYNIQTNHAEEMMSYIEGALSLAVQCNYHKEIGILLRLKGLYNIMIGDYPTAEGLLDESIRTFNVTKDVAQRYAINIAAAKNYIGEIRFQQGRYEEAIATFDEAIALSRDSRALSSMSIFYINKGKALFALGHHAEAREEFKLAYGLYGQFDSFWKRPVLDAYMALCEAEDGAYEAAVDHIRHALTFSRQMNDPRSQGAVYFAAFRLLETMPEEAGALFAEVLTQTKQVYRSEAIGLLDPYRDHFELEYLKQTVES